MRRKRIAALGLIAGALFVLDACTRGGRPTEPGAPPSPPPRSPRPVPGWAHLSELRPAMPPELGASGRSEWESAWSALSADRLEDSHRLATALLRSRPELSGARTLFGWLELRAGRVEAAASHFDAARRLATGASERRAALSGSMLVELEAGRLEESFERLEALRAEAPDHVLVASYRDRLRMDLAERWLRRGRELGVSDPLAAATALERSLDYAPEAVDLTLELARLYRAASAPERALREAEGAAALRPRHLPSLELYGELLEEAGRISDALETYESARELASFDAGVDERIRLLERRARSRVDRVHLERVRESATLTREGLAAVLCSTFERLLSSAPRTPVIVIDVESSWARDCILTTLASGLQEAYPGHKFEPETPVTRVDFRETLRRVARFVDRDCSVSTHAPPGGAQNSLARERVDAWTAGSRRLTAALALSAVESLVELAESCRLESP